MKFKNWDEKSVPYACVVSRKLDGVRVEYKDGLPFSRQGKPLYNLPKGLAGIYEAFLGGFKETIQTVRSQKPLPEVALEDLYQLHPKIDRRLVLLDTTIGIDSDTLWCLAEKEWGQGGEGLIVEHEQGYIKIKKTYTVDPVVIGWIPGKGKHAGKMGALETTMGKVGTGFTDADRERITEDIVGHHIECKCMEITEAGKMRMPVFLRERPDKD